MNDNDARTHRPARAVGPVALILSGLYGLAAAYVFCFSGSFGSLGESVVRDVALITVTVVAALALTYISLLAIAFLRRSNPVEGDPDEFEWHLLIPCRDEESVIAATVSAARTSFPSAHIWVIDDDSEDSTARIVRGLMDFDVRVHLVSRVRPEARTGKGDALNAAFVLVSNYVAADHSTRERAIIGVLDADGFLSDNALPLLAGPAGFGDPEVGAAQLEVWMKNRGDRRPRPQNSRIANSLGRFLIRMQDIEFRTSNSAMQLLRIQTGTVGMGGNGQFTRLAVLDSLTESRGRPWGTKLSEDYELGLNILGMGYRNHYLRDAHVSQEALPYFRRLLTQRTRWAQGIMECGELLPGLRRGKILRPSGTLEIHYFMSQPWIMMLNLLCIPVLLVLSIREGTVVLGDQILAFAGLVFLVVPYALWGPLYRLRAKEPVSMASAAFLGLGYLVYVYFTYLFYPRAIFRLLTGRTGWAKTKRNADGLAAVTAAPAELQAIELLDAEELVELSTELEGRDDYAFEVLSSYAIIWPRRRASLEQAVAAEDARHAADAAASIRVSSQTIGALRLAGAAAELEALIRSADFDACRQALGVIDTVGTDTVEEIRRRFLEGTEAGRH